jgi:hypothetical protein
MTAYTDLPTPAEPPAAPRPSSVVMVDTAAALWQAFEDAGGFDA